MLSAILKNLWKNIDNIYQYTENKLLRSAVSMKLAIIGEATSKIKQENPTIIIENHHKIISLRNRIIHAYDGN